MAIGTGAAILGAGALGLAGSLLGSKASSKAAKQQAAAAGDATATQMAMYQQTRQDQLPWLGAGTGSLRQLSYLMGINPADIEKEQGGAPSGVPYANINKDIGGFGSLSRSFGMQDFQTDPGYQFRMDEGMKALQRSAAAKGGLMSGAALKSITRFGQDTASQEYQNAYNRYNINQSNLYNRLAGVAGTGQAAAGTLGNIGQSTAGQIGENITGAGNARAAGTIGQANAWATGLNNLGSAFLAARDPYADRPWLAPGNVNPYGGYY